MFYFTDAMNAVNIFILVVLTLQLKNHFKYADTHGTVLSVIQ